MIRYILICCLLIYTNVVYSQTPKNLTLLSSTNVGQVLAGCNHYTDSTGKEYALLGASNGIMIYDITIPSAPVFISQLPGVSSTWHEITVQGHFAYAVSEGIDPADTLNGLQIIDLSFLPTNVPYKFYTGDVSFPTPLKTSHSVTSNSNYVFVNGHNITAFNRGVLILDISDKWNPVFVSAITTNYTHDSYVRGNTLFTSDIHAGLFSVYDISNPISPVLLATQTTPGLFNHNSALSDDGLTLFTTDEKPNFPLASYDVSNLGNITLLDTVFNGNFTANEVHNVRVLNDFLLCPSYGSQLTIIDAARPKNMLEVGNFTTGNSLCWDADPFLTSGNIIATDMNGNFYILSPTYKRACYLEGIVTDSLTGMVLPNASIVIQQISVQTNSNLLGEYYTGYADSGMYNVTIGKSGYVSKGFNVNLQQGQLVNLNAQLVPFGSAISDLDESEVNIFPNPASEYISIKTNSGCDFKLYDNTGKLVLKGRVNEFQNRINVKNLSPGTYFVELSDQKQLLRKKIFLY